MSKLDGLDLAQIYGSGYRDGERGADKRDLSHLGDKAQAEYLEGYERGQNDAYRVANEA